MRRFGIVSVVIAAVLFGATIVLGEGTTAPATARSATAPTPTGPVTGAETAPIYGASTPEDAEQVRAVVDKWTAAPADHRAAGVVALSLLPFRTFPLIEEQAERADLSAEQRQWLSGFLERNRPRMRARIQLQAREARVTKWNERTALSAYNQFGHKDPKWDEPAEQGIVAAFSMVNPGNEKTHQLLDKAIKAGCNDALVGYLDADMLNRLSSSDATHENLRAAVRALLKTKYPASRKVLAAMATYQDAYDAAYNQTFDTKEKLKEFSDNTYPFMLAVYNDWDRMIAEPGLPRQIIADLAMQVMNVNCWSGDDRKKYILDRFIPSVERAFSKGAVPLICRAEFNINYAWDARGGGTADTVTPEGWQAFRDRLARAHKFLEQAWEKNPTWPQIPTNMIVVAMGEGMKQEDMELWYSRAMQVDPDSYEAGRAKMLFLEPKWGGSAEKVLEFGHQCVAEQNWAGNVPFMLISAHKALVWYAKDSDAYWRDPEVWQDLQSVFVPLTEGDPDDYRYRSDYCYWACRTEHWEVAEKQFQILGDRAQASEFRGKEAMERLRADAKEKGGK
jgi:hypothetical protein